MKPAIFTEIDALIATNIPMSIAAVAEESVVSACYEWMKTQPEYTDIQMRAFINYKGYMITPASAPVGGSGYVVRTISRPA